MHNDGVIGERWPDVVLPMQRLIVEYDSFVYHSDVKDALAVVKQHAWETAGYSVLRVREQGLDRVES